jgi:hypothetical protein
MSLLAQMPAAAELRILKEQEGVVVGAAPWAGVVEVVLTARVAVAQHQVVEGEEAWGCLLFVMTAAAGEHVQSCRQDGSPVRVSSSSLSLQH